MGESPNETFGSSPLLDVLLHRSPHPPPPPASNSSPIPHSNAVRMGMAEDHYISRAQCTLSFPFPRRFAPPTLTSCVQLPTLPSPPPNAVTMDKAGNYYISRAQCLRCSDRSSEISTQMLQLVQRFAYSRVKKGPPLPGWSHQMNCQLYRVLQLIT